jgi:hypothetical protein
MRTTLDIDEPLLRRLRDHAHAEGIPFKEMVNRVIARGLDQRGRTARSAPYRCPTFALGIPFRPIDKALAIADALEDDERASKLAQRK